MPTHKGIKLSIISQWELKIHPEFPHPESTQFTYRTPELEQGPFLGGNPEESPASKANDSKADRLLGRQSSVISVYIPSMSGARFFVRYNVIDAVQESPWYYFKLFLNGRHITSWGTNSKTRPSGQVMRAFCQPDSRFDYKDGKNVFKNPGTEQRSLFFDKQKEEQSAAADGGLIEVRVFRARGRKRRLPQLEVFKDQGQWGIVMPSGGLVDNPQDERYYDWILRDAKDNPFITFKFHYRTWESLITLNLIPSSHPRTLMSQTPSMMQIPVVEPEVQQLDTPKKYLGKLYTSDQINDAVRINNNDDNGSDSSDDGKSWMSRVFDSNRLSASHKKDNRDAFVVPHDPDPFYPIPSNFGLSIDGASSQRSWLAVDYNRPLPELPNRPPSASHSRPASAASRAPSVTPSLMSYLDRDQSSPEPFVGNAVAVSIDGSVADDASSIESSSYAGSPITDHDDHKSGDELDGLTPPPTNTKRQGIISSHSMASSFSLPNVTIRKNRKSPKKLSPLRIESITSSKKAVHGRIDSDFDDQGNNTITSTLSITESEWMRRTPSPVKYDSEYTIIERKLWSPGPDPDDKHKSPTHEVVEVVDEDEGVHAEDMESEEKRRSRGWENIDRGLGSPVYSGGCNLDPELSGGFVPRGLETEAMHQMLLPITNEAEMREGNWI